MDDFRQLADRLTSAVALRTPAVAIAFLDAPPPGVHRYQGSQPAGCSFWRLAGAGHVFYTEPAQHANCPIGTYTHRLEEPGSQATELDRTLSFMAGLGYLRPSEVPSIPRLSRAPGVVVYAPLADTPVAPDVVLLVDAPARLMLVHEAAGRAGVAAPLPLLGRPTCMALPAALANGAVLSTGCVGNRVYTDVGEDGMYLAVPGRDLRALVDALPGIVRANQELAAYHRDRRAALATE